MKRVLTIQDISCVGKCSLTVALPVLSVMGLETAVLPTALLSTHTAFSHFTFADLSDQVPQIAEVWKKEEIDFSGIYTGYLGSVDLVHLCTRVMEQFREPDTLVMIDPAMADNGKLYTGFDENYVNAMRDFCKQADLIVPNVTEAAMLLDRPYPKHADCKTVGELLDGLLDLGIASVVITGVSLEDGMLGAVAGNQKGERFRYEIERIPAMFHGTGDLFASTMFGAVVRGMEFSKAIELSVNFVGESIRKSMADPEGVWYGVNFEQSIPYLVDCLRA